MKCRLDSELCTACGLCSDSIPEIFRLDDDTVKVIKPDIPVEMEEAVRDAASDCPVEAIIIEG